MSVMLSALLVAAQGLPWVDPAPTGRWAESTAKLASELLPPDMAADVVSHEVTRSIVQGGQPFSVEFSGRARPSGDGFCERYRYYVHIGGLTEKPGAGDPPARSTQLRLGPCPSDSNAIFADLNPGVTLGAKQAIRWLAWAQSVARSSAPLPFRLSCQTETGPDRCGEGGRKALTDLPLDKLLHVVVVRRAPPHHWNLAVTDSEPGQLYWEIAIDATPGTSSIGLSWKIPVPF